MLSKKELLKEKICFKYDIKSLENEVDKALKETNLVYDNRVEIIIVGEYPFEARDIIKAMYVKDGDYSKVEHQTSSENGERAGLTSFTFWF